MKLKKLTAVGLAAVMCVMAAGCGSNGETNDKKQENTQKTHRKRRRKNPVILRNRRNW